MRRETDVSRLFLLSFELQAEGLQLKTFAISNLHSSI